MQIRGRGLGGAMGLVMIAVLALAGCSQVSLDEIEPRTGVTEVRVADSYFDPRVIEVPASTEVTWVFVGNRVHDVVGDGWGSALMTRGTFVHTLEVAGTYDYLCTLHANMTGRVIVAPSP
jgi:plastocyanin